MNARLAEAAIREAKPVVRSSRGDGAFAATSAIIVLSGVALWGIRRDTGR